MAFEVKLGACFLNIGIPGINGYELARGLKAKADRQDPFPSRLCAGQRPGRENYRHVGVELVRGHGGLFSDRPLDLRSRGPGAECFRSRWRKKRSTGPCCNLPREA